MAKALANELGLLTIPYPSGVYTGAGTSDILACADGGVFVAVECKTEGDDLRPGQRRFLERVRALGGIAIEARSTAQAVRDVREELMRHESTRLAE